MSPSNKDSVPAGTVFDYIPTNVGPDEIVLWYKALAAKSC